MTYRTDLVELLPWVTRLTRPTRCDEYRWAHMTSKARRDPIEQERYRCQHNASWRYVATRARWSGKTGSFCWNHLVNQLHHVPDEQRNRAWWTEHLVEVNAIRARYGYTVTPPSPADVT